MCVAINMANLVFALFLYKMVIQNSLLIREFLKNLYISNKALKKAQKKCLVYLKLPWIGKNFLKFERKIKLSINNCFGAVQP